MRPDDREPVLTELRRRLLAEHADPHGAPITAPPGKASPIETLLHETSYFERLRLERKDADGDPAADREFWRGVRRRLLDATPREQQALLEEVVGRFGDEVVGNLNQFVYDVATLALPAGLGLLLNAASPRLLLSHFPRFPDVTDRILIRGEVDHLRALRDRGVIVLAPTHISNLDSIVVGWALHALGLPPFIYGAGLNLFKNRMMSFFMHNLGAYRVDRKKKAPLYKRVLKEYATLTLERGYDNLFFPGGTRSRSGLVEKRLKLGLLGCGLKAYINNLKNGVRRPNVYVVPCTFAYPLVLEAASLIDDHLKEAGKARYIIEDDEFSQPRRMLQFATGLATLHTRITVRFGRALDPFGNAVDDEGRSLDPRGRVIDPSRYVLVNGAPEHLAQRDAEYTRELGEALATSYHRENVVVSTHLLAFCCFRLLAEKHPGLDLYRLLRQVEDLAPSQRAPGGRAAVEVTGGLSLAEVHRAMDALMLRMRRLAVEGEIRLNDWLDAADAPTAVERALRGFSGYHSPAVLLRHGDRLYPQDMKLLYYYHNRLVGYGFEDVIAETTGRASAATGPGAPAELRSEPTSAPAPSPESSPGVPEEARG